MDGIALSLTNLPKHRASVSYRIQMLWLRKVKKVQINPSLASSIKKGNYKDTHKNRGINADSITRAPGF